MKAEIAVKTEHCVSREKMSARKRCFRRLETSGLYISHFRAHMSAAPLKRFTITPKRLALTAFPRSHERGPIEALRMMFPLYASH